MSNEILHQRENSEWSEQFLKSNGEKFNSDCVKVLRMLYKGMKLTGKQVNDITGMADGGRRLRDIKKHRTDCKKGIRKKPGGGLEGVEYWLDIPHLQTKSECIERSAKVIDLMKTVGKEFVAVFTLDENPPTYGQGKLFE